MGARIWHSSASRPIREVMTVSPAKSRVSYTQRLHARLHSAGVDLAWLYPRIERDEQGFIAAKLSHQAYGQPEELSQGGYPAEQISQAERVADIILDESARYIISLFEETKRTWVEPEPAMEGLHEAEESSEQAAGLLPAESNGQMDDVA